MAYREYDNLRPLSDDIQEAIREVELRRIRARSEGKTSGAPRGRRGWEVLLIIPALLIWEGIISFDGVSLADPSYAMANYIWPQTQESWFYATFLANRLGTIITQLPEGATLRGMNLYCSLVGAFPAILSCLWFRRRGRLGAGLAGALTAVAFAWCPPIILYNSLGYALRTAAIFVYTAALTRDRKGPRRGLLLAAGALLGAGVLVRFSNLTWVLLILVLFAEAIREKRKAEETILDFLIAVLGYGVGAGIPAALTLRYRPDGWIQMIQDLFGMTEEAEGYGFSQMLLYALVEYGRAAFWALIPMALALGIALATWLILRGFGEKGRTASKWVLAALSIPALLLTVRIYYGRGMFEPVFTNYRGMYGWGMLLILMGAVLFVLEILDRKAGRESRILAGCCLILFVIGPLGSNNGTYPVINDLYIAAPLALVLLSGRLAGRAGSGEGDGEEPRPLRLGALTGKSLGMMAALIFAVSFVCGALFHLQFRFDDGMDGTPRAYQTPYVGVYEGMWTSHQEYLMELESIRNDLDDVAQGERAGVMPKALLSFGEDPGINLFLELPPALPTAWPYLDSYTSDRFIRDLSEMTEPPMIAISMTQWDSEAQAVKRRALEEYIEANDYYQIYGWTGTRYYLPAEAEDQEAE